MALLELYTEVREKIPVIITVEILCPHSLRHMETFPGLRQVV